MDLLDRQGMEEFYDEEKRYDPTWRAELILDDDDPPIICRTIIPFQEQVDPEFLDWDFYQALDLNGRTELLESWMVIAVFGEYMTDCLKACELLGKVYANMPDLFDRGLLWVIAKYRDTYEV